MEAGRDLREAGVEVLGSAGMAIGAEVIKAARAMSPRLRVLAPASYLRDVRCCRTPV